jgi:uncharacterized protein (DUF302 family)
MDYYFSKTIDLAFNEAVVRVTASLQEKGFGIITEINLHDKFKEKLGVDFRKYKILGACNPGFAYKALLAEEKIGTMLPCNILVIEKGEGRTEVSAVNPIASMMAIQNRELEPLAKEVAETLKMVIEKL